LRWSGPAVHAKTTQRTSSFWGSKSNSINWVKRKSDPFSRSNYS
jgi:hypothetical protein